MNKLNTTQVPLKDGGEVTADEIPIRSATSGIARVELQDGTAIELTIHITNVYRAIVDHGDSFEVVHSVTYDDHLDASSGGPPPEVVERSIERAQDAPADALTA